MHFLLCDVFLSTLLGQCGSRQGSPDQKFGSRISRFLDQAVRRSLVLGGLCTFFYAMTIPIYFNLGGEITFPTGEAHSECYHLKTENRLKVSPTDICQTLVSPFSPTSLLKKKYYSVEIFSDVL